MNKRNKHVINSSEESLMNRRYALWGGGTKLGIAILLALLTGIGSQVATAQTNKPELPTLSLTGEGDGWKIAVYPDGRIWVPRRGNNGERTLIVPVYIKNCWRSTADYEAFPIYSFKFKVQFDSTALEYMGVEKNGPTRGSIMNPTQCLARDFEFTSHVARDTTYQSAIAGPLENRLRGKRVLISAVSSKPLPQTGDITTSCEQRPFEELVYLKFRVIANPASNPVSARTPLIITNDTLFYNDFQVGHELPFPNDPAPSRFAGLGGTDNYFFDQFNQEQIRDPLRPSRPGMIWVEVTDEIPRLSFTNVADRRFRIADSVDNTNNAQWFIVNPITIDSGSTFDPQNGYSTRDIDVINATSGSRLTDLVIQSDSKWLRFQSFRKGGGGGTEIDPFPTPVREGFVPMLDKGILGTTLGITPQADPTTLMRDLNLRIICDPDQIMNPAPTPRGEYSGIYVGYLSFESPSIDVSPVRLKVTFIIFRQPFEPADFDENDEWRRGFDPCQKPSGGMRLEVRNSNNPIERTYIVFGVGARATNSVDTLFGETVYLNPLNSFGARWYPKNAAGEELYANGLGDLFDYTFETVQGPCGGAEGPKSSSRDIRDIYSDETIMYLCKFNAGSALNYPVVVSWDTDFFSPDAELFIRDTLNGSRFNVNMREATGIGGSRRSFTIRDADINAFIIEYTLPKVAQFPVIKKGWNLLSLPVNPSSSYYRDIFKNGLNIPFTFAQNIYQNTETDLRPGVGYFVKYADEIDRTIAGARIRQINEGSYQTRVYDGWNTVGSLSYYTSTENLSIAPLTGATTLPSLEGDVYQYVTDRGYQAVSEIVPGLGYWIKVRGTGYYELSLGKAGGVNFATLRDAVTSASTPVVVRDNDGREASLYISENTTVETRNVFELPPLPPNNLFDVRFSNQAYVEDAANPMIKLQGATFPLTLTINNPSRNYTIVDPISGETLGAVRAGTMNVVKIEGARSNAVRLMGGEFETANLTVNVAPNPVNATSTVDVTIPSAGMVNISVYNSVGELVQTIYNGSKNAGPFTFDLNAAALAPGRYIVKVMTNGSVATTPVTVVR